MSLDDHFARPIHDSAISKALELTNFNRALNALAGHFSKKRNQIAVMSTRTVQRHGKKIKVTTLRYAYDRKMNSSLKLIGTAWFDRYIKGWNLPAGSDEDELAEALAEHFEIVVDENSSTWRKHLVAHQPCKRCFGSGIEPINTSSHIHREITQPIQG